MSVTNLPANTIIYLPPLPTATPTAIPTATPTATLFYLTLTPVPCGAPAGWITYIIKSGDTLSHLAWAYNTTVYELQVANCMGNSTFLIAGQPLKVPNVATRTPSPTPVTVTPTVILPDLPPTLDPIPSITIPENSGLQTISLSGITSGAPYQHDVLSVTAASSNPGIIPNPTVSYSSPHTTGSLSFTPLPNVHGIVTISVTVDNGRAHNHSITRTFTVTIFPTNHAPVAYDQSLSTPENTALAITLTASDADGDPLTFTVLTNPSHGTLIGTLPNLTYEPGVDYAGSDSFTFKANDGKVDSNIATIAISINPVNSPPVAHDQSVSTLKNTPIPITLTAFDPEGRPLTYFIVTPPAHGVLSGDTPNVTYTPEPDYTGPDNFTFRAFDGILYSNTALISINITEAAPLLQCDPAPSRFSSF